MGLVKPYAAVTNYNVHNEYANNIFTEQRKLNRMRIIIICIGELWKCGRRYS
jgi:uncharacterized protein YhjY with autotransporter beta-barrel domain